ncbi:oxygenase [Nocardia donostiensis]|uniref:FAD-dependent monooxygenase n=1 Tax=Nocardia donostiensis TaxID=1538463 RepID=UPI0009DA4F7E|nr:FAD-dependent monooxygenase [Nocardia donostiensis]OQS13155.1 oxygenase [Nocardia donostiensis]
MGHAEVVVVGAGPSGLTLAVGLAAQGVAVRVVDTSSGPAATSRANILHARGVEVLQRLGAMGDLRERSLAPVGMRMYVQSRPIATMRFAPDDRESVQALFVSQARIEEQLRHRLTELGVEIEWGRTVTTATQEADGVTVEFADGTRLRTDWLVGCDGARSVVRDAAGIEFPGVSVVEQFLLADVDADWDRDRTTSAGFYHRSGLLLAIPMRGNNDRGDRWRLMADVPAVDRRLSAAEIVARFEELLRERAGETGVRIRKTVWTSVFRIHRRLAADYRSGRILLAGDAAHIHSPIGGQGMNTGIGDAENLAWKLALVVGGRAHAKLLDTYTAERRPLATDVLRTTTANTKILVGEGTLARFVRDRIFIPLLDSPKVRQKATRTASQLWVTYRKGPLGSRRGPAPRPGDRIPDRECARLDGSSTRLYSELQPAWVVLARPDTATAALMSAAAKHLGSAVIALTDPAAPHSASLLRPDGHLAWHGHDPAELHKWFAGTLCSRMGA